jgi:ligand-binding sensor domain-containing protein/tRNA A-37 threonylcarbamoyl transferase component Bud32
MKRWLISVFIIFISIISILSIGATLFALDPDKAVTQYLTASWDERSGLPSNYVRDVIQTNDGYIWLGTDEGLARFDGVTFTIFDDKNTPAMTGNHVFELYEDYENTLWICTIDSGLLYYKDNKIKQLKVDGKFNSQVVQSILVEDNGSGKEKTIWIATDGDGLFEITGHQVKNYSIANGLPDRNVKFLSRDSKENLWAGTSEGLVRLKDDKITVFSDSAGFEDSIINSICETRDGKIWVGTDKGLYKKVGKRFVKAPNQGVLERSSIKAIYEDRKGTMWIGSAHNGLARFRNDRFELLPKEEGLTDDTIFGIHEDREGSLWVARAYSGILQLKDGKVTCFTTREGLADNVVFPIYEDIKRNLWIGTNNGLNRLKDGKMLHFTTRDGLNNDVIDTIYEDRRGRLWVGTDDGVTLLKILKNRVVKQKEFLRKHFILGLNGDSAGNVWAGTNRGLYRLNAEKNRVEKFYPPELKKINANFLNFAFEDSKKNLWVSTYRYGLAKYNNGFQGFYTEKDGLASGSVSCIYEDGDGVLWIGTISGLSRYADGTFTSFTRKDGLFNNNIYQILEDGDGYLWMSCNKGIFKVSKKELHNFAGGSIKGIHSVAYGKEDGMLTSTCNGGVQSAGCRTSDGRLWFPTTKGVVMIDPVNMKGNRDAPPVLVEYVQLDGKVADISNGLEVPPGVKRLELHFTALSFVNPQQVKFKYKLEGYEEQWVDSGLQRSVWYTNLDGGTYRFKVIACNNDGVWNHIGAGLDITVIPPFWRTWWFTILALLVFAGFSYIGINLLRKVFTMAAFWKRQKYVGQFRLLDRIGSGGMGTVYKASNLNDKTQTVAIKVLREEMSDDENNVKRFKQEAAIIDQLDHPNIVKVMERGQTKNNLYIAMEYLQGKTLAEKISEEKKLKLFDAVHIMSQVADAIGKIHRKNIIHRDLKPDNIMLINKDGDSNFVKLLDFGLAKTQFQTRLTQTGIVIGTINYMSPEQISGKGSFASSDIYALGILFYEMITGEKPFFGATTIDIMKAILDKTPIEPIRFRFDLSFDLNHLIMGMLEKEMEKRPEITEVKKRLGSIYQDLLKIELIGKDR